MILRDLTLKNCYIEIIMYIHVIPVNEYDSNNIDSALCNLQSELPAVK